MHASEVWWSTKYKAWWIILKFLTKTWWFIEFKVPYAIWIQYNIQDKWTSILEMATDGLMTQNATLYEAAYAYYKRSLFMVGYSW